MRGSFDGQNVDEKVAVNSRVANRDGDDGVENSGREKKSKNADRETVARGVVDLFSRVNLTDVSDTTMTTTTTATATATATTGRVVFKLIKKLPRRMKPDDV